jgi:hypothetical protein
MSELPIRFSTKRAAPLVVVGLVGTALVIGVARPSGSSAAPALSAATATVVASETCPTRLAPGSRADIVATVRNTGDEVLTVTRFDADAGTPGNESDDFLLTYQSGDGNGNGFLDPGETWTYVGSYTLGDEDSTNIVGVAPVRGQVLVKLPGENRFVPLQHLTEIPIGSQVDATRGAVRLISAVTATQTNSAEFFDGIFTIRQRRANRAVMQLILGGGNFRVCRRGSSAAASVDSPAAKRPRRPVRRLWGSGKGRFETRGRYSSATVRGTRWLVVDRCDGTLTRVRQGVVLVKDFKKRRSLLVRAGRSYFAAA